MNRRGKRRGSGRGKEKRRRTFDVTRGVDEDRLVFDVLMNISRFMKPFHCQCNLLKDEEQNDVKYFMY